MKRPNLFIIGAPKCGTTALSEYLREHPKVFFCRPKEPYYFAEDMVNCRTVADEESYLALFKRADPARHTIVAEGSVFYLSSTVAVERIEAFQPEARYIVMLRDPVALVQSFHAQLLRMGTEDEPDFAQAWDLQAKRRAGQRIPATCRTRFDPKFLFYEDVARLGEQMERLLSLVPRERVLVIRFDDFAANTRDVYEQVLAFLGLPLDHRTDFPAHNRATAYTWPALGRTVQGFGRMMADLKRTAGFPKSLGLANAFARLWLRPDRRHRLDPQLHRRMVDTFRPDIRRLATLLGWDLSAWTSGPEADE